MNLFITSGKIDNEKTLIGFGDVKEYNGEQPNARDVFYKISAINAFLKSVDADKIPLTLKIGDKESGEQFYKADAFYKKGINKDGIAYALNKISIELKPEKKNEKGEVVEPGEKIYATKLKDGYAFDTSNDMDLVKKFNESIKKGVNFTLSATKNSTLEKYPELLNVISQIDKSANIEIDFVQQKGAVLRGIHSPAGTQKEAEAAQQEQLQSGMNYIMSAAKKIREGVGMWR